MTPAAAYHIVSTRGWLSRQPDSFVSRILGASELKHIPRGQFLYGLDDPPGGIFGIVAGAVVVLVAPGALAPKLIHLGGPGWWTGDAAFLSRTRRRAEIAARSDVCALHVSERSLELIAAEDPLTWRYISDITIGHFDDALSLAACLMEQNFHLRLIQTLLRLAGPSGTIDRDVALPLTQEELGEVAGLSRNSVGRVLTELAELGALEIRYRRLVIYPPRLRELLPT